MGTEKIRRIIIELTRIRNGLRELVGEGDESSGGGSGAPGGRSGASGGGASAGRNGAAGGRSGTSGGGDPLEEILGALPPRDNNLAALNPEDEDVIVVDISLPSSKPDSQPGSKTHNLPAAEPSLPTGAQDAKIYPKKPPPRKRK